MERLKELVSSSLCNRCGWCLYVCPTFLSTRDENFSPRGRLEILKAGLKNKINLKEYRYELNTCITCSRCFDVCFSGVDVGRLIKNFRKRSIFMEYIAGKFFKKLPVFIKMVAFLNRIIKSKKLFTQYDIRKPINNEVMIFQSCPDVFVDNKMKKYALRLINGNAGFNKFMCCGLIPYTLGFIKTARMLAEYHIETWKKSNKPVYLVLDASCYNHLKNIDTLTDSPKAKEFISSIAYFVDFIMKDKPPLELDSKVLQVSCKTTDKNRFSSYFKGEKSFECCGGGGVNFILGEMPARKQMERKLIEFKGKCIVTNSATCMKAFRIAGLDSTGIVEFVYEKLYKTH